MVKRKRTTPMDEEDRINERIAREENVKTEDQYDEAFNSLFEMREDELSSKQKALRKKARNMYIEQFDIPRRQKATKFKRRGKSVSGFRSSDGRFATQL